jgi:hypothetical protein
MCWLQGTGLAVDTGWEFIWDEERYHEPYFWASGLLLLLLRGLNALLRSEQEKR